MTSPKPTLRRCWIETRRRPFSEGSSTCLVDRSCLFIFFCFLSVAVYWDITFGKLASPDWVTLGAHFFHPSLHSMVTLATMDFDQSFKMDYRVGLLFWKMIDAGVKLFSCSSGRHHQTMHFDPSFFVADGQGSLWKSIQLHWGHSESRLESREQTCVLNFEQGLQRLLLFFSSEGSSSHRDEFRDLVRN